MITNFIFSLTLLTGVVTGNSHSYSCDLEGMGLSRETVEVHVIWRFRNAVSNQMWLADALQPTMTTADDWAILKSQTQVKDGFEDIFCFGNELREINLQGLKLTIGGDVLSIAPRPIKWISTEYKGKYSHRKIHYGKMTTIVAPPLPDPAKLIFYDAQLSFNASNEARLRVKYFNPGTMPHPEVRLDFNVIRNWAGACSEGAVGENYIIPVLVKFGRNGIDIFSGDPAFPGELFERTLHVIVPSGSCMEYMFLFDLGPTGVLAPGLGEIRYVFRTDGEPMDEKGKALRKDLRGDLTLERALGFGDELTITGKDLFPDRLGVRRDRIQIP